LAKFLFSFLIRLYKEYPRTGNIATADLGYIQKNFIPKIYLLDIIIVFSCPHMNIYIGVSVTGKKIIAQNSIRTIIAETATGRTESLRTLYLSAQSNSNNGTNAVYTAVILSISTLFLCIMANIQEIVTASTGMRKYLILTQSAFMNTILYKKNKAKTIFFSPRIVFVGSATNSNISIM
jgi:hypothetical protein